MNKCLFIHLLKNKGVVSWIKKRVYDPTALRCELFEHMHCIDRTQESLRHREGVAWNEESSKLLERKVWSKLPLPSGTCSHVCMWHPTWNNHPPFQYWIQNILLFFHASDFLRFGFSTLNGGWMNEYILLLFSLRLPSFPK